MTLKAYLLPICNKKEDILLDALHLEDLQLDDICRDGSIFFYRVLSSGVLTLAMCPFKKWVRAFHIQGKETI